MIPFCIGLAAFLALNVVDAITTLKILDAGGHESNPVLAKIIEHTGEAWPWIKMAISVAVAALLFYVGPGPGTWLALAGLLAAWVYVIRHNLGVIDKQNARALKDRSKRMALYAQQQQEETRF